MRWRRGLFQRLPTSSKWRDYPPGCGPLRFVGETTKNSAPRASPGAQQTRVGGGRRGGGGVVTSGILERLCRSPYARLMRLDKPIGSWLLLLPSSWAIVMSAADLSSAASFLAMFGVGSILLRGAGCTINDYWDRSIDGHVARTATRPIPAGEVSPRQALLFGAVQCLAGLPILLAMNSTTITLGVLSLVPVALYPLAKRVSAWPQAVLGLTINFGALMGWTATTGSLAVPAVFLYLASVNWTQVYDTIYAHSDKHFDEQLGMGSSALTIGDDYTRPVLTLFSLGKYASLVTACASAGMHVALPCALFAPAQAHLLAQVWRTDLNNPEDCVRAFTSNRDTGLMVLLAVLLLRMYQATSDADHGVEEKVVVDAFVPHREGQDRSIEHQSDTSHGGRGRDAISSRA